MPFQLPRKTTCRAGVLSDTHGHLPQAVVNQLRDVDLIIHAGDIDTPDILPVLARIAPVVAVQGNMDRGKWTSGLSMTETTRAGGKWIHVLHDLNNLDLVPEAAGFSVVVSGHTHRPHLSHRSGVMYLNPGSATHPRRPFPASLAILEIREESVDARFIDLERQCALAALF